MERGTKKGELPPGLAELMRRAGEGAPARPVEKWDPPHCGVIDMRIAADGTWFYMGTPITRPALVRLFASVLRREPDGEYVLVTPVEKVGIHVDDAPFLAVEMAVDGEADERRLTFRTNVDDVVTADAAHPIRFAIEPQTLGVKPYVTVRAGLEALLTRALTHDLVDLAQEREGALGLISAGTFFSLPEHSEDGAG
ncbi:DUF1285 domain-containing protein [Afifella aestuarii]|uniref:DUF1285 domain-containing protein n=1 Tax=Afifella aestuarii TaxID=1909496 RepID=UPI00196B12DB